MQRQSLIKFPNGFRVVLSGKDTRSVGITVNIACGVEKEAARQSGITHIVDKLIRMDLERQVNRFGGELFSKVTYEFVEISIVTMRENLSKMLTALSRALFDFSPKMDDFKRAKAEAIGDLERIKLSPAYILDKLTTDNLYRKVGLSNNFYGIQASLAKITFDETKDYLVKVLSSKSLALSVVGDIFDENANEDSDENSKYTYVYGLVMELFYGKLINYKPYIPKYTEYVEDIKRSYSEKTKILYQDRFQISYPCPGYASNNYKYIRLIDNYILGYLERYADEKDYVYNLQVSLVKHRNNSYIRITFAVDSDMAGEAFSSILNLVNDIREQGITIGEFERLKTAYLAKVIFNNETALDLSRTYARRIVLCDEVFDIDKEINSIRSLDYNNFKIVMKESLSNNHISVARVGKKRDDIGVF